MRHLVIGLCVFATAFAGAAPTAPASSLGSLVGGGGTAVTAAEGASELPFRGNLQATERVAGALHHLVGSGNGTHLGRLRYAADLTINEQTGVGVGTVTWTAANGDQIFAQTTGEIVSLNFPTLTLRETQIITGGAGRFRNASGTITVNRTLDLVTHATTGSFTGTLNLGH